MKKYIKEALFVPLFAVMIAMITYAASFSDNWYEDTSGWHIRDGSGAMVRSAWLCDDVQDPTRNSWYLIDANGDMVSNPLVKDGTGNYYSLETAHEGYYGMLRYQNGTYDGVILMFNHEHDGSFGAVTGGLDQLKSRYDVADISNIDNSSCVYTSSFDAGDFTITEITGGSSLGDECPSFGSEPHNVKLSASSKTVDDYPGNFIITERKNEGWEEYRSSAGGYPSYMYIHNGSPVKGWVSIEGIWWYSPSSNISSPTDQDYARKQVRYSAVNIEDGTGSVVEWAHESDIDKRKVAEFFIEYLNEYRRSLGIPELYVSEEQMMYAQERADRNTISHEGNTADAEICGNGAPSPYEYSDGSPERAFARHAFEGFKASSAHDSIMRNIAYTSVGTGFLIHINSRNEAYGYVCEANFMK